jgi:hypothetical protein
MVLNGYWVLKVTQERGKGYMIGLLGSPKPAIDERPACHQDLQQGRALWVVHQRRETKLEQLLLVDRGRDVEWHTRRAVPPARWKGIERRNALW